MKTKALLNMVLIHLIVKLLLLENNKLFCFVVVSSIVPFIVIWTNKRLKLDCGVVIYVINWNFLNIIQNQININLINTKQF